MVFDGIGLHTGKYTSVCLKPAPSDSGIVFLRKDKSEYMRANPGAVSDTAYSTTLGSNGTRIKTVEHVLAALSGIGVDNLVVEVDGPEIPILDGSSARIVELLLQAGITEQDSARPYLKITKPVEFKNGSAEISAVPYDGRLITYHIYFDHCLLGHQSLSLELEEESFIRELAPARTFGFLKDVKHLRSMGLAKGGSLENAVILSDTSVLNSSGLRFEDEFVRHKVLDFIGDMSLGGFPIYGHITAKRSGHTANLKFLKKLLTSVDCWEIVSGVEAEAAA